MTNEERLELLQEMINIGFGRSSAAIADLLNVFVTMSVPQIYDFSCKDISDYLIKHIDPCEKISMVRQIFRGDFRGETILVFPDQSGTILTKLLVSLNEDLVGSIKVAQEEIFIEISNIIIGACMEKISALLNSMLSYNMPQIILQSTPINQISKQKFGKNGRILVIENSLTVEDKHLKLFLFIIISEESLTWLYQTLDKSLESLYI